MATATKWSIEHHGSALAKFLAGLRDEQMLFEAAALIEILQTRGIELREPVRNLWETVCSNYAASTFESFMSSDPAIGSCSSMECSRNGPTSPIE